jgi:hypothetical protein
VEALHFYSGGIPRVVNLLCEHGLINAYADDVKPVPARTIREIAREFQFDRVEPLGGPDVFGDALTNKLIAMQSTLATALSQRPNAAPQIREEEAPAPVSTNSDTLEIATVAQNNAYDLLEPIASAARSGAETQTPSASVIFSCDAGVNYVAELAGERATLAPLPRLHLVESKDKRSNLPATAAHNAPAPRDRASLHAKVDARSNAIRPGWQKFHASIELLFRKLAKRRFRVLSAFASPDWTAITETSQLRLKRAVHSARSWYHESLLWLNKRPENRGSLSAPRKKAPAYRWLHEPWAPQVLVLANSRLFALRRKLIQRKK